MHANHSPLSGFLALVDAALESPASALSNAVSMTVWKPRSEEWLACKSELESARLLGGPLELLALWRKFVARVSLVWARILRDRPEGHRTAIYIRVIPTGQTHIKPKAIAVTESCWFDSSSLV